VSIFNRASDETSIPVKWADVGIKKAPATARDLWAHTDVKLSGPEYSATVPGHGVVLLRLK